MGLALGQRPGSLGKAFNNCDAQCEVAVHASTHFSIPLEFASIRASEVAQAVVFAPQIAA
jgi:hypothetical protein